MSQKNVFGCIPVRVTLAILSATGIMALYMLRVNISVAIIAMAHIPHTSLVAQSNIPYCLREANFTQIEESSNIINGSEIKTFTQNHTIEMELDLSDKIVMTSAEKGSLLGSYFYGYIATCILGGRLAELYGTKRVYGVSMIIGALLTLLTPIAAYTSYGLLMALRIIIGIVQGVVYPAVSIMVAKWIPPFERARFMSFVYLANCLGVVVSLPLCGFLVEYVGWPSVFYVTGAIALVWGITWMVLMYETPSEHPRISKEELNHILEGISGEKQEDKPKKAPWLAMFKSVPLWAITIAHCGNMYGFNLLVTQLPSYLNNVMGLPLDKNTLLATLPFITRFVGSNGWSWIGDTLISRGVVSIRVSRIIFSAINSLGVGTALAIAGFQGCNAASVVGLLCIGTAMGGASTSGYMVNTHDIAPNLGGTLFGFINTFAFATAMLAPISVGLLTPDDTPEQWQSAFLLTSALLTVTFIVYAIFAKFELQPWNFDQSEDKKNEEETEKFTLGHSIGAVSMEI